MMYVKAQQKCKIVMISLANWEEGEYLSQWGFRTHFLLDSLIMHCLVERPNHLSTKLSSPRAQS